MNSEKLKKPQQLHIFDALSRVEESGEIKPLQANSKEIKETSMLVILKNALDVAQKVRKQLEEEIEEAVDRNGRLSSNMAWAEKFPKVVNDTTFGSIDAFDAYVSNLKDQLDEVIKK